MIRYVFRDNEPLRIKAAGKAIATGPQAIGEALEKIRVKNGGDLKPAAVVEAAKDEAHPFHPHFEWDDALAAHAHRLDQARSLITIVRIKDEDTEEGTTNAFISVRGDGGVSYRAVAEVKKSWEMQNAVLRQAMADLKGFQARYKNLREICKIVAEAEEKLAARIARNERTEDEPAPAH